MWESTPRRWPHILGCTLQDGPSGRSLSVGGILMRGTSSRSQRHPSHILTSHFHLYTPAMPMLLGKDDRRYISYWKSRGPTQPHPTPQTSLILSFIPFRRSIRMTHADNQYLHVQWTLWWWLISTATKGFLYFWIYPMTSTFNPHESLSNGHCPCPLSSPSSSIAVVFMIYVSMVHTLFTLFPELTEWWVSWLFSPHNERVNFSRYSEGNFCCSTNPSQVQILLEIQTPRRCFTPTMGSSSASLTPSVGCGQLMDGIPWPPPLRVEC